MNGKDILRDFVEVYSNHKDSIS